MCSHKSRFPLLFIHRAKPVSEMKRSGIELHDGVERRINLIPRADTGAASAPHVQPVKILSHAPTQEPPRLRMSSPSRSHPTRRRRSRLGSACPARQDPIPRADTGAAPAPHVQPEKNHGIKIESNKNKERNGGCQYERTHRQ